MWKINTMVKMEFTINCTHTEPWIHFIILNTCDPSLGGETTMFIVLNIENVSTMQAQYELIVKPHP